MSEDVRYAMLLWVCAALCGVAFIYQLKCGRGLDWFGLEVTRARSSPLYWTYVLNACGCMIFLAVSGAALLIE